MSSLIVGAGYTAQFLYAELIKTNKKVYTLSRSASFQDNDFHIQADLDKTTELKQLLSQFRSFDQIYYLAPPNQAQAKEIRIQNFLQCCENLSAESLVYVSTSGVYGDRQGDWVSEDSDINPITDRAKRRVSAEKQLLASTMHNVIILRVPGIYGPKRLPINKILNRRSIVNDNESGFTNLIHVYDLVTVLIAAAQRGETKQIYNVSDTKPIKSSVYYKTVAKLANLPEPKEVSMEQAKKSFDNKRLSFLLESRRLNVDKMLEQLQPKLKFRNIEEGIKFSLARKN